MSRYCRPGAAEQMQKFMEEIVAALSNIQVDRIYVCMITFFNGDVWLKSS